MNSKIKAWQRGWWKEQYTFNEWSLWLRNATAVLDKVGIFPDLSDVLLSSWDRFYFSLLNNWTCYKYVHHHSWLDFLLTAVGVCSVLLKNFPENILQGTLFKKSLEGAEFTVADGRKQHKGFLPSTDEHHLRLNR